MNDKKITMDGKKKVSKKSSLFSDIVLGILLGMGLGIVALYLPALFYLLTDAILGNFYLSTSYQAIYFLVSVIVVPLILSYFIYKRWNLRAACIAFAVSMIIVVMLLSLGTFHNL